VAGVGAQQLDELVDTLGGYQVEVEVHAHLEDLRADCGVLVEHRARGRRVVVGEGRQDLRLLEVQVGEELLLEGGPFAPERDRVAFVRARDQRCQARVDLGVVLGEKSAEIGGVGGDRGDCLFDRGVHA